MQFTTFNLLVNHQILNISAANFRKFRFWQITCGKSILKHFSKHPIEKANKINKLRPGFTQGNICVNKLFVESSLHLKNFLQF